MSETKVSPNLEATLKSLDTEEFIDIHFYRPIGYRWALLFNRLNVSPNSVTVASIFIGIAAGICFYFQSLAINIVGMLLLVWANMYDSADGQLARMTGKKRAHPRWHGGRPVVHLHLRGYLPASHARGLGNLDLAPGGDDRFLP